MIAIAVVTTIIAHHAQEPANCIPRIGPRNATYPPLLTTKKTEVGRNFCSVVRA